jgi:hypothetical protein
MSHSVIMSVKRPAKMELARAVQNFTETCPQRTNATRPDWFTIQNQNMKTRFILFQAGVARTGPTCLRGVGPLATYWLSL